MLLAEVRASPGRLSASRLPQAAASSYKDVRMPHFLERAFKIAFARALRRSGAINPEWAFSNAAYTFFGYLCLALAPLTWFVILAFIRLSRQGAFLSNEEISTIGLLAGIMFLVLSNLMRRKFRRDLYEVAASNRAESAEDSKFWLCFRLTAVGSPIVGLILILIVRPAN